MKYTNTVHVHVHVLLRTLSLPILVSSLLLVLGTYRNYCSSTHTRTKTPVTLRKFLPKKIFLIVLYKYKITWVRPSLLLISCLFLLGVYPFSQYPLCSFKIWFSSSLPLTSVRDLLIFIIWSVILNEALNLVPSSINKWETLNPLINLYK